MPEILRQLLPAQSLASGPWLPLFLLALCLWAVWRVTWLALALLRDLQNSQLARIDRINAELPQTQCGRCGHPGCRPYARAISQGEAINRCPPGGSETIARLALLLGRPALPLDPAHGETIPRQVAYIREDECIGCRKCIRACPVDAILGAPKLMHTVIESECTGCDLCIDPCPVDCIDLLPAPALTPRYWQLPQSLPSPRNDLISLMEIES